MSGAGAHRPAVLLVNPPICSRRAMRMPLSLLALAAVLEGKYRYEILDGNLTPDLDAAVGAALDRARPAVAAISVMPGPQVAPAIEISALVRARRPEVPILWGGYFPTLYPEAATSAPYVDIVVRGQGEDTLIELLGRLPGAGPPGPWASVREPAAIEDVAGITWKAEGRLVHNAPRAVRSPDEFPPYPYERLGDVGAYLRPSFMGERTGVHQAAIGCRFHCTFCGVVSMFGGVTCLQAPARLGQAVSTLRDRYGATGMQYYDNNFFDREETSVPLLEVLATLGVPWWCYARADALVRLSPRAWDLVRRSRLRMAYIGAEAASDALLRSMKKGTRVEQTLEVAARCLEAGVVPEFSLVLGGPEDPEGEIEKTLAFIRRLKAVHPASEIVLYFYSPTPRRAPASIDLDGGLVLRPDRYGPDGPPLPATPEQWAEPRWVDYVCHRDAPWLSPRTRQRVRDFARVLECRFPSVQDVSTPRWRKRVLRMLASWRYATGVHAHPWELDLARRLIPLRPPDE